MPHAPEIVDVQVRLNAFLSVEGYEGDLKLLVAHECEGLADLADGRRAFLICACVAPFMKGSLLNNSSSGKC